MSWLAAGLVEAGDDVMTTNRRSLSRIAGAIGLFAFLLPAGCGDTINVADGVSVIPGDLTVYTQSELALLAGVKQVLGRLTIGPDHDPGDPIRDLSPLRELVYVADDLVLEGLSELGNVHGLSSLEVVGRQMRLSGLEAVQSLDGLEMLWGVGSRLDVIGNPALTSIAGLSGLHRMQQGGLTIANNPALSSLHGLEGLTRLGDSPGQYGTLAIQSCDALTDLRGLDHLAELRTLNIENCAALADLRALGELRHLASELELRGLPQLTSLEGLQGLDYCPTLSLSGMPALTSLAPLSPTGLTTIELQGLGIVDLSALPPLDQLLALALADNAALESLVGLPGTVTLTSFKIRNSGSLSSLAGLSGHPVTVGLAIESCQLLVSLAGLEAVAALNGTLVIAHNEGLLSLDGLGGLGSVGDDVVIGYNAALCDTLAEAFAEGLDVGGNITLIDNADCGEGLAACPRCSRIRRTEAASVTKARIRMAPPQRGQTRGSTS